ncbi:hypothetical protein ACSVH2_11385 [Flavobacterium sp. RSB2_4_14]|uniref:hypothetical protein n=1 Tax=Flavobacterium sp. RSB2_4_14 TaxID=3447665 RepID=UPI003F2B96DD
MKKLLLIAFAFLLSNCDTNDDGFYNNIYIDVPNLVTIQTQPTYSVGDFIYVNADFSRYLPEVGQSELLDIYHSTGGATQFTFTYLIERKINATEWEVVTVNDSQLDINLGSAQNGSYIYAICEYNNTDQTYEYNVGFPLLNAGEYRLSFGYNSASTNSVELRSESSSSNLIVNINSVAANIDAAGYYYFNVN